MQNLTLFVLILAVASAAASHSLRKNAATKQLSNGVAAKFDLERFEEQARNTKFNNELGKLKYKMQQNIYQNDFFKQEGTTYDAEGNPLITKKLVGSGYPSSFGALYYANHTSCDNDEIMTMSVIAFDICLTEYTYDHKTQKAAAGTSSKTTYSGSGPYSIKITSYEDESCSKSEGSGTLSVSNTCGAFSFTSGYGYAEVSSAFPDSPKDAPGLYTLGFASKCNTEPYSGYWYALFASGIADEYDTCTNSLEVTCENGAATVSGYNTADCSGAASFSEDAADPTKCSSYHDDDAKSDDDDTYASDELYQTTYCTAGSDDYTFEPLSDDDAATTCFAGSEIVTLESGASKPIADIIVGDRVLAFNSQGVFVFSDVVAVPHSKNNDHVMFNEITLANGADIRMTGEHLLPVAAACGADAVFSITAAKDVATDSCVMTVGGQTAVLSNTKVLATGIYTIVTNEEYVVVNGVVASPFAASHFIGNTFYNVYRAMYRYVPGLFKSSAFQAFHSTFATLATKTW